MLNMVVDDALNNCAAHCNYCADACLSEGDIKMMVDCIRTDRACAEICSVTASLLASNYANVKGMVEQCRDICKKCADVCDKHATTNIRIKISKLENIF